MVQNLQNYQNGRVQYWDEGGWAYYFLLIAADDLVLQDIYLQVLSPDPTGMVSYLVLDRRDKRRKMHVPVDRFILHQVLSYNKGGVHLHYRSAECKTSRYQNLESLVPQPSGRGES